MLIQRITVWLALLAMLISATPVPVRAAFTDDPGAASPPDTARPAAQTGAPAAAISLCGYDARVAALLQEVNIASWSAWVRQLSGADSIEVGGLPVTIRTRYSSSLFNGISPAYPFVKETISAWYPSAQIEEHAYAAPSGSFSGQTWKNLALTIPGQSAPEEIVLLTAHLDSTASGSPAQHAPGADDNATGAAALLEAARVLKDHPLDRTLRLIWFTGEEQIMIGSRAYANALTDAEVQAIQGVVNVDMIGYDSDGDRCFEMHVGDLPASNRVGQCIAGAINTYDLGLTYDYFTNASTLGSSDHSSFWLRDIGAVELLENYSYSSTPGGCGPGNDRTPNYHTEQDTFANMYPTYGFDVAHAGLAGAFSMAAPLPSQAYYLPMLKNNPLSD